MNFNLVRIRNFKAIDDTTLKDLGRFNVIVGTNGSGKSSVLQALHWCLQSGRNPTIKAEKPKNARSLSPIEADYMPSPDYKNAGNKGEPYGNKDGRPQLDLHLEATLLNSTDGSEDVDADLWIRAARNEGISVHIPSNNRITELIRNKKREISAYIPGLAGIPLREEKLSKRVVLRQAAAGDANTVLRNLLHLLWTEEKNATYGENQLQDVKHWVSQVLGKLELPTKFNDEKDSTIRVEFKTEEMEAGKPLELAGLGLLQVIQIFAYLVYFRPHLLLIDEPDSHLHPGLQEKLVNVLYHAAQEYDCQVIMTTHSPSVVRAMPPDAKLFWMKDGKVQKESQEARAQMGWGLLDKSVLLLSEDADTDLLQKIIAQWPEIHHKVAIWPLHGVKKLPPPESLAALRTIFGRKLKIAIHRDGDFMTSSERTKWAECYEEEGLHVWITQGSDIEAYFASAEMLKAFGCNDPEKVLEKALDEITDWEKTFNNKREKINLGYPNRAGTPKNEEVADELSKDNPAGKYVGKKVMKKIRDMPKDTTNMNLQPYGKQIPHGVEIAPDLKKILQPLI